MIFKTGKLPAQAVKETDLHFSDYRLTAPAPLPPHPARFGYTHLQVPGGWGMLANDRYGCCVIAAAMHHTMQVSALVGNTIKFDDASAIQTYSEATGFDPKQDQPDGSNPTDQGTDMVEFMTFWKNTGILDAAGNRHKIVAAPRISLHTPDDALEALWLFGSTVLGIKFPSSAMDQTQTNEPWDVPIGPIEGGHAIQRLSCYNLNNFGTWGQAQGATDAFMLATRDEEFIPITADALDLASGKNFQGFNMALLLADANQLPKA